MSRRLTMPFALLIAVSAMSDAACGSDCAIRLEFIEAVASGNLIQPLIAVDEAGQVTYSEPGAGEQRGQLSNEEYSALVRELTGTLDLDAIDSAALWDEIVAEGERTGLSPRIEGAATTRIVLTWADSGVNADREVVIECSACRLLATRYPAVESLQRVAAAQSLLENLRAVMQVGGFDEARRLAELANDYLKSRGLGPAEFTCRDLCSVRSLPDGARFITFNRDLPEPCTLSGTLEPGRLPVWID